MELIYLVYGKSRISFLTQKSGIPRHSVDDQSKPEYFVKLDRAGNIDGWDSYLIEIHTNINLWSGVMAAKNGQNFALNKDSYGIRVS